MAVYPTLNKGHVATFTGRPATSFTSHLDETLRQSRLLFKIATCLEEFPEAGDHADLAKNAIMAMADLLYLQQPHARSLASPFTSETIGSYSYSKAAQQVRRGDETGVMWFDLAVEKLGVCTTTGVGSGSLQVFTDDLKRVDGKVVGPKDEHREPIWFDDPSEGAR